MKTYDHSTVTLLASGKLAARGMILFDFGGTNYGFWTGLGTLTYSGVDCVGAGQLIEVQDIPGVSDLSSVPLIATLTAVPNSALSPDVLATIEAEAWHQSVVVVSNAFIDPDTRTVVSVERLYKGYFDRLVHEDQIGGKAVLTAYLESKSRDHLKTGYRVRSDADQKRISATDGGFSFAATAGLTEIVWGQAARPATQSAAGAG